MSIQDMTDGLALALPTVADPPGRLAFSQYIVQAVRVQSADMPAGVVVRDVLIHAIDQAIVVAAAMAAEPEAIWSETTDEDGYVVFVRADGSVQARVHVDHADAYRAVFG